MNWGNVRRLRRPLNELNYREININLTWYPGVKLNDFNFFLKWLFFNEGIIFSSVIPSVRVKSTIFRSLSLMCCNWFWLFFNLSFSSRVEDYSDVMVTGEHYDLENASTIAPSDIDLVYRYKDYRARDINTVNNASLQHKHAPLARLSPSVSELTAPRILTLQDISPGVRNHTTMSPLTLHPHHSSPNMAPPPPPPPSKAKLSSVPPAIPARKSFSPVSNGQLNHHSQNEEDDDSLNSDDSFSCSTYGKNSFPSNGMILRKAVWRQ